jgi:hypothetical protein
MNARELRIGNIVYNPNLKEIRTLDILDIRDYAERRLFIDFEPIPLTEEWHNKFGVKKDGFEAFEYKISRKNNSNIKVIFSRDYVMLRQGKGRIDDDLIAIWNKDIKKRDMYVHEWQNLYFCLCGEELIIK